jgi:hypothetical protein
MKNVFVLFCSKNSMPPMMYKCRATAKKYLNLHPTLICDETTPAAFQLYVKNYEQAVKDTGKKEVPTPKKTKISMTKVLAEFDKQKILLDQKNMGLDKA